jgi:uncharacterized protein (TIGR04168 family)
MSTPTSQSLRVAVVGDVHDLWDPTDHAVLKSLGVDLVLFVGDFGNESVKTVRAIAALDLPKATVFGNHDAWYSATDWGLKKCPYDRSQEDWVQDQIDLLGPADVGYGKRDFPDLNLSVVGSRPFSWGGPTWKQAVFYQQRFGVKDLPGSTARILAATQQTAYSTVLFVGHNGPAGLGDRPEDPCGKDWQPLGGDYGDPDFQAAIAGAKTMGKTVPLVAFGHMHHQLRHTKEHLRKAIHLDGDSTVYLNAARVPRIVRHRSQSLHNFSLVSLQGGQVTEVVLVWVDQELQLVEQEILYSRSNCLPTLPSSATD